MVFVIENGWPHSKTGGHSRTRAVAVKNEQSCSDMDGNGSKVAKTGSSWQETNIGCRKWLLWFRNRWWLSLYAFLFLFRLSLSLFALLSYLYLGFSVVWCKFGRCQKRQALALTVQIMLENGSCW